VYGLSLFLWNIASLETENVPSTVGANVGIYFPNRRGERREREHMSKWLGALPPQASGLYL
jgi:hypothetical protein